MSVESLRFLGAKNADDSSSRDIIDEQTSFNEDIISFAETEPYNLPLCIADFLRSIDISLQEDCILVATDFNLASFSDRSPFILSTCLRFSSLANIANLFLIRKFFAYPSFTETTDEAEPKDGTDCNKITFVNINRENYFKNGNRPKNLAI